MTSTRPILTDPLLRDALASRAAGPSTTIDVLDAVLPVVRTTPQHQAWGLHFSFPGLPAMAMVILLAAAFGLAALAGGIGPSPGPIVTPTPTPISSDLDIAFVQADYSWDGYRDPLGWALPLVAVPRIATMSSTDDEPLIVADVPGTDAGPRRAGWPTVGPAVQWSPDGSRVAFTLAVGAPGIYVMHRDGSHLARITEQPGRGPDSVDPAAQGFAWSPDGTHIAFTTPKGNGDAVLYLVDTRDGRTTVLAGPNSFGAPLPPVIWSPNGQQIAFARSTGPLRAATHGIFIINADGTGERVLVEVDRGDLVGFGWSRDSTQLAFMRSDGGVVSAGPFAPFDDLGGVWIIGSDGSGLRKISEAPGEYATEILAVFESPVEFSPDGSLIAVPTDSGIRLINVDGSGERVLEPGPGMYAYSWSPDWSLVVFSTSGGVATEEPATWDPPALYVVNVDGSGLRWLADGEYPSWAP